MPRKCAVFLLFLGFLPAAHAFGQSIVVTSPAAGIAWHVGETRLITWTKTGTMDDEVKIRLMREGNIVLNIAGSVPNSGSYSWTIPASVEEGSYVVRVRTMDDAVWDNSEAFTVAPAAASPPDGGPPSASGAPVAILTPNGKETIPINRPFRITWNAVSGGAGDRTADLLLLLNDRPVGVIAENLPVMQRRFEWTAGRLLAGTAGPDRGYKIRIRIDGTTIQDDSDRGFILAAGPGEGGATGSAGGDLELVSLEQAGDKVVARIKSTFPRFAGSAIYEMRRPHWAPTPIARFPLSMLFETPGEKTYPLENVVPVRPNEALFCTSNYEMFLDITNQVEEMNELNNHKTARLYGNPSSVIIDRIDFGGQRPNRDTHLKVRDQVLLLVEGEIFGVTLPITVYLHNCGYDTIPEAELRISQTGYLPSGPTGGAPSYRTRELARVPVWIPALGEEIHKATSQINFFAGGNSEILIECVWSGRGLHSDLAKFRFTMDVSELRRR